MYLGKDVLTRASLNVLLKYIDRGHIEYVSALPTTNIKHCFYFVTVDQSLWFYDEAIPVWREVGGNPIIRVDELPSSNFKKDKLYLMEHFYAIETRYSPKEIPLQTIEATVAGLVINGILHTWDDVLADLTFYMTYIKEDSEGRIYKYHATVGVDIGVTKMCYNHPGALDGVYAFYNNAWHNLSGGAGSVDATLNTIVIEGDKTSLDYKIFWSGTQAQYDAITTKNPYTLYLITD